MTDDRSMERAARSWLEIGPTEAPERAIEAALLLIDTTPQERDWHVPWRLPDMTSPLRVASAAVLGALVLGGALYALAPGDPGPGGPGPSASPTPSPVASPTATVAPSATPSAVFPPWLPPGDGAGILAAGSQTTRQFLAGSTFTVPEGWVNDSDYTPMYTLFPDTPASEAEYALSKQVASSVLLTDRVANNMFAICEATGLFQGATASDVIDAAVANDAFRFWTSEPVDVTIGGLSGRLVDLRLNPEWAGRCALNADDPPTKDYSDARMRLIVLDTPDGGTIGIAISSGYSADHEAFLADAMPIVESFQFDFAP